jgi:CTP synthase
MQMAIEYSRNVLGYADANSTEMNEHTEHPVVNLMEEQKQLTRGTMRLGAWKCDIKPDLAQGLR